MRCAWAENDTMRSYHDEEWGVPLHDERRLFELLTLEGAQAGLSWATILNRRDGYRRAFVDFNPETVAAFTPDDVERLVNDEGIIRHRGKIESTVANANAILQLRASETSLDTVLWVFVDHAPRQHDWANEPTIPATSTEAASMSKDLKRRGFRFMGPTTCYAFMQAAGLVNDHHPTCFRFNDLRAGAH